MDRLVDKLLDLILLPKALYNRLTDQRASLYAGVLFVGLADFFLPDVVNTVNPIFSGKSGMVLAVNTLLVILSVLLLGIVDTFAFSLPLFDFFKFLKKKTGEPGAVSLIKVVKVYILSNILLIPVNMVLYFTFYRYLTVNSSESMKLLGAVLFYLILIWISAVVTRGTNVLFAFGPLLKRLCFIVVFIWSFMLQTVLGVLLIPLLMKLFM